MVRRSMSDELKQTSSMLKMISPLLPYEAGLEVPTKKQIFEALKKGIDIRKDQKNWIYFFNTFIFSISIIAGLVWMIYFASFKGLLLSLLYGSLWLSIFSTTYYHRYSSHRAFKVNGRISGFILKNLGLRLFIEEIFAVSHQIHHTYSDTPHDPHFTERGGLFCYTSDVTMMRTNANLNLAEYENLRARFVHIPIHLNSFTEYQKWGTLSHPLWTLIDFLVNWTLWISFAWLIAGVEGIAILGMASFIWSTSVRNFNYKAHGAGIDKRTEGRDVDPQSKSLNLMLPGMVAGEWHSNHHLYPRSANCGFKTYQIDFPYRLVQVLNLVGIVKSYRNDAPRASEAQTKEVIHGC